MWSVGNSRAELYVGTRSVRLHCKNRMSFSASTSGLDEGMALLRERVDELPKRCQVRVWLSGGLCRPFLIPEVEGATSDEDWRQVAESFAEDATGLQGPCRVWLDAEQRSPRLAVALSGAMMDQLFDVVAAKRVHSLQPWWAEALRVHPSAGEGAHSALAVRDCDALTVLLARGVSYAHAQSYPLIGTDEQAVLDRALITANWPVESVPIVRLAPTDSADADVKLRSGVLVFGQGTAP